MNLKDIILKTLKKEGGAAGLKALKKAVKKADMSTKDLEKDLSKMSGVKQHKDGDYISTPLSEVRDIIEVMIDEKKKKKKKDRCHRKADSVYGTKTSAYKSGAIVKCRKGMIWKKKKNENVAPNHDGKSAPYGSGYDEVNMSMNEVLNMKLIDESISEAKYIGKTVKLNKPMRGDVKKFKVYVKNPKGNVVKVNFGQKGMNIKKNNPKRRKAFRARHRCDNPGPKTMARYWSCKKW